MLYGDRRIPLLKLAILSVAHSLALRTMGYGGAKPFDVPGLYKVLEAHDLEESRNL